MLTIGAKNARIVVVNPCRRLPLNKLVQIEVSRCCATKLSIVFNTEVPVFCTYIFATEAKRRKFTRDIMKIVKEDHKRRKSRRSLASLRGSSGSLSGYSEAGSTSFASVAPAPVGGIRGQRVRSMPASAMKTLLSKTPSARRAQQQQRENRMGRLREGTNEEEDDGASPVPVPVKKAGGGGK